MQTLGVDIGGTSVKLAARREGRTLWTGRSSMYQRPTRDELIAAIREAATGQDLGFDAVGLCVPGLLDRQRRVVTFSVNVPGLVGHSLDHLIAEALGAGTPPPTLVSDANAAAYDLYTARQLTGRLLVLVLGTGIGAAVIDEHGPLYVDGESPGHFGQLDVSLEGAPVIGPDGGVGSLEGYLGVAALQQRYGKQFAGKLPHLAPTEAPLRALARAIRIAHAMYRPDHICLAGGIGNALVPLLSALRDSISRGLTNIARQEWTLACGDSSYHAALGAAKLAEIPQPPRAAESTLK